MYWTKYQRGERDGKYGRKMAVHINCRRTVAWSAQNFCATQFVELSVAVRTDWGLCPHGRKTEFFCSTLLTNFQSLPLDKELAPKQIRNKFCNRIKEEGDPWFHMKMDACMTFHHVNLSGCCFSLEEPQWYSMSLLLPGGTCWSQVWSQSHNPDTLHLLSLFVVLFLVQRAVVFLGLPSFLHSQNPTLQFSFYLEANTPTLHFIWK